MVLLVILVRRSQIERLLLAKGAFLSERSRSECLLIGNGVVLVRAGSEGWEFGVRVVMMMMMMMFIRPVLNLKGPSLYYIIHFVQCFQDLLKPIQKCLF